MGSAITGMPGDAAGILINPGILPKAPISWQINYTSFVLDIHSTSGFVIFRAPLNGKYTAAVQYLDYGAFVERDSKGIPTGEFFAKDLSLNLAYGISITQKLNIGISTVFAQSQLSSYRAEALFGTVGILYYDTESTLAIGLSYHNFGTFISAYIDNHEPLPKKTMIGISKQLEHLPLIICADLYQAYKNEWVVRLGGEFNITNHLFLRCGTSTRRFEITAQHTFKDFLTGSSAGIGINTKRFQFDIALMSLGNIGTISSLSISQHF